MRFAVLFCFNPGQTFVGVADFVPHCKDTARDSNAASLSAFTTFYWVIGPITCLHEIEIVQFVH